MSAHGVAHQRSDLHRQLQDAASADDERGGGRDGESGQRLLRRSQSVSIRATANGGYSFAGWTGSGSGSYSGLNNPANVTMNGPISEAAVYVGGASGPLAEALDTPGVELGDGRQPAGLGGETGVTHDGMDAAQKRGHWKQSGHVDGRRR